MAPVELKWKKLVIISNSGPHPGASHVLPNEGFDDLIQKLNSYGNDKWFHFNIELYYGEIYECECISLYHIEVLSCIQEKNGSSVTIWQTPFWMGLTTHLSRVALLHAWSFLTMQYAIIVYKSGRKLFSHFQIKNLAPMRIYKDHFLHSNLVVKCLICRGIKHCRDIKQVVLRK